jgi:hypothetical protein
MLAAELVIELKVQVPGIKGVGSARELALENLAFADDEPLV